MNTIRHCPHSTICQEFRSNTGLRSAELQSGQGRKTREFGRAMPVEAGLKSRLDFTARF